MNIKRIFYHKFLFHRFELKIKPVFSDPGFSVSLQFHWRLKNPWKAVLLNKEFAMCLSDHSKAQVPYLWRSNQTQNCISNLFYKQPSESSVLINDSVISLNISSHSHHSNFYTYKSTVNFNLK